ncbi:MAG TPA: low-specificity L-threonine aldolase [Anaerolineaceae bacterium]|nr:low-specificity L-threonine aldolase [Anaerolineaceae bacterium]
MQCIDLRSDTVTMPTPEMREAMAKAVVGDDVYREDPTINKLQALAAEKLGKEAGLFVSSGTMGNLAAVLAHCARGDELIEGNLSHTFLNEAGGISALGGVHAYPLPNQPDGTLELDAIQAAIRSTDDEHQPHSRLVILENTQNMCGGVPLTVEYTQSVADLAHQRGLLLHLDGARLFNAAAALQVPAKALAEPADSVMFCLSKGLCAPVGSVLCGSREFIEKARRIRKQLGGGMRQAGILAAAGIIALEKMADRLGEDHCRAQRLADGLREIPGIVLQPDRPATNMVYLNLEKDQYLTASQVATRLEEQGILVDVSGPRRFRLVTHYWIDDDAVNRTVAEFTRVMRG